MVDLTNLELAPTKKEKKSKEPLTEDNDLVQAMQKFETAKRRISYRAFAAVAHAAGETSGPKFTPLCFQLLNRMPGGLDALVCRANGTQPNSKHAEHPANAEEWAVVDSTEEIVEIIG